MNNRSVFYKTGSWFPYPVYPTYTNKSEGFPIQVDPSKQNSELESAMLKTNANAAFDEVNFLNRQKYLLISLLINKAQSDKNQLEKYRTISKLLRS